MMYMMNPTPLVLLALLLLAAPQAGSRLTPDPPSTCDSCEEWNARHEPFKIFGNTYYVGVAGISAVLVTSDAGHILLDGGLPQTAARIDESIRALGFQAKDIRVIAASHEHYDHVGGIAALQRVSGATVVASPAAAGAIEKGEPREDDPQFALGRAFNAFPAVKGVRRIADGEVVQAGPLSITAHHTPGHTPGSTSWSWRSCEGARCVNIVFADSLNSVSADGFRFSGDRTHPSTVETFRRSIAKVAALPCDVVISVHPGFTNVDDKLARRQARPATDPFIDPQGCQAYARDAGQRLDRRMAEEKKTGGAGRD
jgi:metallo-beta-lactamase class B